MNSLFVKSIIGSDESGNDLTARSEALVATILKNTTLERFKISAAAEFSLISDLAVVEVDKALSAI